MDSARAWYVALVQVTRCTWWRRSSWRSRRIIAPGRQSPTSVGRQALHLHSALDAQTEQPHDAQNQGLLRYASDH